ncbi:hypothetical protein D3C78_1958500 [compost metagenome]
MLRCQFQPSRPLQLAVLDQGRDAFVEGSRVLLAGDHRNELQLARVLGQVVTLLQASDLL